MPKWHSTELVKSCSWAWAKCILFSILDRKKELPIPRLQVLGQKTKLRQLTTVHGPGIDLVAKTGRYHRGFSCLILYNQHNFRRLAVFFLTNTVGAIQKLLLFSLIQFIISCNCLRTSSLKCAAICQGGTLFGNPTVSLGSCHTFWHCFMTHSIMGSVQLFETVHQTLECYTLKPIWTAQQKVS